MPSSWVVDFVTAMLVDADTWLGRILWQWTRSTTSAAAAAAAAGRARGGVGVRPGLPVLQAPLPSRSTTKASRADTRRQLQHRQQCWCMVTTEVPLPPGHPQGLVHVCERYGRHRHVANIRLTPTCSEGTCAFCGQYIHVGHHARKTYTCNHTPTSSPVPDLPHSSTVVVTVMITAATAASTAVATPATKVVGATAVVMAISPATSEAVTVVSPLYHPRSSGTETRLAVEVRNLNNDAENGGYCNVSWPPQYEGGEWDGGGETRRVTQPNHVEERGAHLEDGAEVNWGTGDTPVEGGGLLVVRFPEPYVLKIGFSRVIPGPQVLLGGKEVLLGDNASSVHCTGDTRDVIKKRSPRSTEECFMIGDGSKKVGYFGQLSSSCPCTTSSWSQACRTPSTHAVSRRSTTSSFSTKTGPSWWTASSSSQRGRLGATSKPRGLPWMDNIDHPLLWFPSCGRESSGVSISMPPLFSRPHQRGIGSSDRKGELVVTGRMGHCGGCVLRGVYSEQGESPQHQYNADNLHARAPPCRLHRQRLAPPGERPLDGNYGRQLLQRCLGRT